jgi:hypothetical protein
MMPNLISNGYLRGTLTISNCFYLLLKQSRSQGANITHKKTAGSLPSGKQGKQLISIQKPFTTNDNEDVPIVKPGNPYLRGCISTVDLHALASLDQLHLLLKTFLLHSKKRFLYKEVNSN